MPTRARRDTVDGAMQLSATAIVCAVRAHGEHGSIVRLLTRDAGLVAGYARGGRSRQNRPVLIPGNIVAAQLRTRGEMHLGSLSVELAHSRGALLGEPLAAAGMDWACTLTAATLPENQPYPLVHDALSALLDAIEYANSARRWAIAVVRYEALLLAELGYGAQLAATQDLAVALRRNRDALNDHLLDRRNAAALFSARDRLTDRLIAAIA